MKVNVQGLRLTRMALLVATAGMLPFAAAQAQGVSNSEMQSRYKADMQRCSTITDAESRRTCQREAGAALQEARRDRLVRGNVNTQANASARCERLPSAQRADCERLMTDSSAVEHGSVSGGGVLRELSITVPVDQASGGSYSGHTGSTQPHHQSGTTYGAQPTTPGYGAQPAPAPSYGSQPAPAPNYGSQPSQAPNYGSQPAPAPSYGSQPAPAPAYGTQPAPGSYNQPAPSTAPYGSMPAR